MQKEEWLVLLHPQLLEQNGSLLQYKMRSLATIENKKKKLDLLVNKQAFVVVHNIPITYPFLGEIYNPTQNHGFAACWAIPSSSSIFFEYIIQDNNILL